MIKTSATQAYGQTIHRVRRTMAEQRKWLGMPTLLDELHRLRQLAVSASPAALDEGEVAKAVSRWTGAPAQR